MALKTLVKISGVNNLSDARYTAGMGVDFLGFNLDQDAKNYVTPEDFAAITGWVSGVNLVGEWSNSQDYELTTVMDQYPLDYLQLNARHAVDLAEIKLPVIIKIDQIQPTFLSETFERYKKLASYYLVESDDPVPEEVFSYCSQQAEDYPILWGSNVTIDNLDQVLRSGFKGIALSGGTELRPGYKDFDQLAEVLEALEIDD